MKLTTIASSVALLAIASTSAFAQAKAAEPDYTLAFNVGAVTDYRYRGISQTRFRPALQGGADFAHKSGFYLGAWASNIKWIKDAGGDANVEIDLYGGYKGSITKDLGFDVGLLRYQYPSHDLAVSPNTTELYGALTYGIVTAKYSHSVTNLFGFDGSKGSGYLDLAANFDLGNGWSVVPHIGHQRVASDRKRGLDNSDFTYTDVSLAVNKDFGNGLIASGSLIATDTDKIGGLPAYRSPKNKNLGKTTLVLGIKYNF